MGTLTTNLGLDKPTVGADADQWGTLLNQSLDTLDLSVQFGALTKSVAGGVNVTLTANEAAKDIIILTGAITANIAVIFPNSPLRRYVVRNNTTGAFTVTLRRAIGTGVVIPQGGTRLIYNDGADILFESVENAQNAVNATNATTATNVSGGTASVTTLTASGAAQLNGGTTTTTLSATGNVTLGDAGADTTTVNSQVSAGGGVGTAGQYLSSRGENLSPQWLSLPVQSIEAGAIGTYAWARRGNLVVFGTDYPGAELIPAGSGHQGGNLTMVAGSSAGTLVGTWRCMGGATDGARPISQTLFLRIA